MRYTVKQLATLAGVTVRTLHHYDQIGLLPPTSYGENGYRYYEEEAVLRLQQILFFRELDFSLEEIQAILGQPEFNLLQALESHKEALRHKAARLGGLIQTIDKTILHLKGKYEMSTDELFEGFDEEKQRQYEEEIAQRYGEERVRESRQRWGRYTAQQKAQMKVEGEAVYQDLRALIDRDPASVEVQLVVARWHQLLRYFYEPTPEVMRGLAQMYTEHPDFVALYEKMHPDMPQFLRRAIEHYCESVPIRG